MASIAHSLAPNHASPLPPILATHQIIVCGSELFTGNTALCFTAFLEGKVKFSQVLKNWVSWVGYPGCRGWGMEGAGQGRTLVQHSSQGCESLADMQLRMSHPCAAS